MTVDVIIIVNPSPTYMSLAPVSSSDAAPGVAPPPPPLLLREPDMTKAADLD